MKPQNWFPDKWDYESDVIVIGTGGAGLITAITARDQGAEVLILEKTTESREGGSTRVSGCGFFCPTDVPRGVEYINACCRGTTPEEVIQTLVEYMVDNIAWIRKMGGIVVTSDKGKKAAEFPDLPGAECCTNNHIAPTIGMEVLWRLLKDNVIKRDIKVMYETQVTKLIQNPETLEILGVAAAGTGGNIYVKARKAVVMACGGFEFNPEMMHNYFVQGAPIYCVGTPSNTGDGIKMVQEIGADLWHMSNVLAPTYDLHFPDAGLPLGQCMYYCAPDNSIIWVDKYGERWRNDEPPRGGNPKHGKAVQEGLYHDGDGFYPRVPTYTIFDETTRLAGPFQAQQARLSAYSLFGYTQIFKDYIWSPDNSVEIDKGWIIKADTIRELALKVNEDPDNERRMSPDTLESSVMKYNEYCKSGLDPDFGRAPSTLEPIETPPFYSLKLWPRCTNTQGGPKHDKYCRAMHVTGKTIPGLYTVGEFGSIWGWLYQNGGNIAECIASGRIAGERAAAEKSFPG